MKAFSGYEPKRSYVREQLPAGGYVVKIMDVKPCITTGGISCS
mgnify:CR=1 FL=1